MLVFHHLGHELHAFFGVLQDGWDFNRAGPVYVVEALGEGKFLELALVEVGRGVDHFVVIGHCCSLVGLLTHDEEVVMHRYEFL